jgi:heat shock protein HspQ
MMSLSARFFIGQIVCHKLFDYRGVIIDVNPIFSGSHEWYEAVAQSRPPKDMPWYHVLKDGTAERTYVAERNLEADASGEPIHHPELKDHFAGLADGIYLPRHASN